MIDWAAVFLEEHLLEDSATANSYINGTNGRNTIGLNPSVQDLITTYDGGKVMAGYGMFDNMVTFGWAMKLFGTRGTNTKCTDY